MYPILISLGPIHIYSYSFFLILSFLFFSFLFWRKLRQQGVPEAGIFDLTFYVTLVAFIFGRAGFVLTHLELFNDSFLKVFALWVAPGLSFWAGLVGGMATLIYLCRKYKVRLGFVLDSLAITLPGVFIIGKIGSFLDGSEAGKLTNLAWGVNYAGHIGRRHPVQLYEILILVILLLTILRLEKKAQSQKWPYGILGVWFFLFYSFSMFLLEFIKDGSVYWFSVSLNQWVLMAIFAESLGALYVRGGGREAVRPIIWKTLKAINRYIGKIYAKISQRHSK